MACQSSHPSWKWRKTQEPQWKYVGFDSYLECFAIDQGCSEVSWCECKIDAFKGQHHVSLSYTQDTSDGESPGKKRIHDRDKI